MGKQVESHTPPCGSREPRCSRTFRVSENERSFFATISDDQLYTLRKLVWAVKDGCVAAPAPTEMFQTQRAPYPKQGASAKAKVKAKAKSQAKAKGMPVARSGGKVVRTKTITAQQSCSFARFEKDAPRSLAVPLEDHGIHSFPSDSEF